MHFTDLVNTLTDPYVIDPSSEQLRGAALEVLQCVLLALGGRSGGKTAVVESHFLATGRLTSLNATFQK